MKTCEYRDGRFRIFEAVRLTFLAFMMLGLVRPMAVSASNLSVDRESALRARLAFWHQNAPHCSSPSGFAFPSGERRPDGVACEDGDMLLFAGLLCASGEREGCRMVFRSQVCAAGQEGDCTRICGRGQEDGCVNGEAPKVRAAAYDPGRWFRSPRRLELGNDSDRDGKLDDELENEDADGDGRVAEEELNSFSPDMSIGVMLALAHMWAHREADPAGGAAALVAAQSWWTYLAEFEPNQCQRVPIDLGPLGRQVACIVPPSGGGLKYFCNHMGCVIRPGDYALLGEFERFLNLEAPEGPFRGGIGTFLNDASAMILSSAHQNDDGFPEHLTASSILLVRMMGRDDDHIERAAKLLSCDKTGLSLVERSSLDPGTCKKEVPANPFFAYLVNGPSDQLVDAVIAACPAPDRKPDAGASVDWMWEKAASDRTWHRSMYWDCIFMANLLLGAGL